MQYLQHKSEILHPVRKRYGQSHLKETVAAQFNNSNESEWQGEEGRGGGGVKVDEYKTNNLYFSPSSGVIVITYSFMTHTMVWSV